MRVVIAEDIFLLREGLTRLLEARGFQVTAAVDNPADLAAVIGAQRPDVAIVDVRLPPTFTDEGLRAALQARREIPGLPVLVLSQYVEQLYARELLADGAAVAALSPREREVLELMAEGRSNAAIGQRLVVTERAVTKHISSIFIKLNLPHPTTTTGESSPCSPASASNHCTRRPPQRLSCAS